MTCNRDNIRKRFVPALVCHSASAAQTSRRWTPRHARRGPWDSPRTRPRYPRYQIFLPQVSHPQVLPFDLDDHKAWPGRKGIPYDEQADFIRSELQQVVNTITDESKPSCLTHAQAFQLMRMFRVSAAVTKNGAKWRSLGQTAELIGAMSSAAVPVLVGLQTQFNKQDDPTWFWFLNLPSIGLSLVATLAIAIERVRGMKRTGHDRAPRGCRHHARAEEVCIGEQNRT
jgi:hypothetical protein